MLGHPARVAGAVGKVLERKRQPGKASPARHRGKEGALQPAERQ